MDSSFDPQKAVEEAKERHEHANHEGGRRWVPIAAALLAVVAALANLASNQRSAESLLAKNEAILAQGKASDAYNFYEARSIKQHAYESLVDAGIVRDPERVKKLTVVAAHEKIEKAKPLADAEGFEKKVEQANAHSERALHAHETLEIAVTLYEVAIVLTSISALVTTPVLTITAVAAAGIGSVFFLLGLLTR